MHNELNWTKQEAEKKLENKTKITIATLTENTFYSPNLDDWEQLKTIKKVCNALDEVPVSIRTGWNSRDGNPRWKETEEASQQPSIR